MNKKILIACISWLGGIEVGRDRAQRDTFLKNIHKFPNLDYKFFIGDETPTNENETDMETTHARSFATATNHHKHAKDYVPPTISSHILKDDEVILHVPDDYKHVSFKVRAMFRWALEHGYDYVFKCDTDTYINLKRLMISGFEYYDFIGRGGELGTEFYPEGGPGYWVSKKAMECLVNEPITFWAEESWVARTLLKHISNFIVIFDMLTSSIPKDI